MALSPFLVQRRLSFPFLQHPLPPVKPHLLTHGLAYLFPPTATSWEAEYLSNPRCTLQSTKNSEPTSPTDTTVNHPVPEGLSLKQLAEVGPPKDTTKLSPPWTVVLLSECRVWERAYGKDDGEQGQPVNVAAKPALAISKRQMLRADRTPIQKKSEGVSPGESCTCRPYN